MDFFDHTPHDTMDFLDHKPPDRGTHFPEHQTSRSPQSVCHDSPPPSFVFPTFPSHHATHVSVADPKPVAPVAPLVPNATRGLIQTDLGMVHFVDHLPPSPSGASPHRLPLVCMHMSPRSTDEFYEVGRLLAEEHGRRVIAVDESGYGQSDNPSRSCTIHDVALTVVAVLDHLAIPRAALCGSLMGCYTALALASQHPERVALLILTHPYFFGDEARAAIEGTSQSQKVLVDSWKLDEEGDHLLKLWKNRASWLDPEVNNRAVLDEFNYHVKRRVRYAQGITIEAPQLFPVREASAAVQCQALVILGTHCVGFFDAIGMHGSERFAAAASFLPQDRLEVAEIEDGSVNVITTHPEEWVSIVAPFVDSYS